MKVAVACHTGMSSYWTFPLQGWVLVWVDADVVSPASCTTKQAPHPATDLFGKGRRWCTQTATWQACQAVISSCAETHSLWRAHLTNCACRVEEAEKAVRRPVVQVC